MTVAQPAQGTMVLYSSAVLPLVDGSYRLNVSTTVSYNPSQQTSDASPPVLSDQHYFDVVGPRFSLPASMVAGCFPPRNAHGPFQDQLPHILLARRTLPWERRLADSTSIPPVLLGPGDAPMIDDPHPWVALLLLEEGEYTLSRNVPLEAAVPPAVFSALGSPANVQCDAIQVEQNLLASLLPTYEELRLLVHVRQVNTQDRELNAYGGDGFFSVVVANRLPVASKQYRAVLVSLEQRTDIVPADAPDFIFIGVTPPSGLTASGGTSPTAKDSVSASLSAASPYTLSHIPAHTFTPVIGGPITYPPPVMSSLVALASWQFTCEGPGDFRTLMQQLDVGMLGVPDSSGKPQMVDTGHLVMSVQDRAGISEATLYRGPLTPYPLTRESRGPYHCADQARRVSPESGAEDISYAAAFEVGRLLAAADPRMALALLQWRRESYYQSARYTTLTVASKNAGFALASSAAVALHTPIVPTISLAACTHVASANLPLGDPYGLARVRAAVGLDPANLAAAWNLASTAVASEVLGANPGTLGSTVSAPTITVRGDTTLSAVAADAASLARLSMARSQVVMNAMTFLGDA